MNTTTSFTELAEFALSNGKKLSSVKVAYETYGKLNKEKSNTILVFHALSGSQHIAGTNKGFGKQNRFWTEENHTGWWNGFVGKKKLVDTEKFFVICMNILGGCYGTTGPSTKNPKTGKPYGSSFPQIETEDMARLQKKCLEKMGIKKLHAVIGGSLGGMLALEFAILFPKQAKKIVVIGSSAKTSSLNTLHNIEQIFAIENDPNYKMGDYYSQEKPDKGLMLARIVAVKTYLDIATIAKRAKKETILPSDYFYNYRLSTPLESYMFHQGQKFVKRFDANTHITILRAMQKYDIPKKYGKGSLEKALSNLEKSTEFLVVSIDSDVCFYPEEQKQIAQALRKNGIDCDSETVHSEKGHDSFLIEPEKYPFIKSFLER